MTVGLVINPSAALAAVEAIRGTGFEIHPWPETPASTGDGDTAAHDHDADTGAGLPRLLAALALAIAAEGLSFFVPDAPWSKGVGLAIAALQNMVGRGTARLSPQGEAIALPARQAGWAQSAIMIIVTALAVASIFGWI